MTMPKPKILVYGSLNIDYVYQVPHFVQPGETLLANNRTVFAGGKGLNQAVALARALGDVHFLGAVGAQEGQLLIEVLHQNNINADLVQSRQHEPCGHTFIQVDANGQNCILLFGGANRSHKLAEIDLALTHFSQGDYLVLQNETNDIAYIMTKAAEKGINVCINASPFDDSIFSLPLHLCKYIIVNEIEGAALVDEKEDSDPKIILTKLRQQFAQSSILLTLGSKGSMLSLVEQAYDQYIECKAYKVQAVDTTAAGDTFLGYFIAQTAIGVEPLTCLQYATAASALAVMKEGASPSIPKYEDVKTFLETHKL